MSDDNSIKKYCLQMAFEHRKDGDDPIQTARDIYEFLTGNPVEVVREVINGVVGKVEAVLNEDKSTHELGTTQKPVVGRTWRKQENTSFKAHEAKQRGQSAKAAPEIKKPGAVDWKGAATAVRAADAGLTTLQLGVITAICDMKDVGINPIRLTGIAERMKTDAPNISHVLKRFLDREWISRDGQNYSPLKRPDGTAYAPLESVVKDGVKITRYPARNVGAGFDRSLGV